MIFQVKIHFKNEQTRIFKAISRPFKDTDGMLIIYQPKGSTFMCHKSDIASVETCPLEDQEDSFRNSKCEANGTG